MFGATGCFEWPMSVLPNSREDALAAKEADFKEAQDALEAKTRELQVLERELIAR